MGEPFCFNARDIDQMTMAQLFLYFTPDEVVKGERAIGNSELKKMLDKNAATKMTREEFKAKGDASRAIKLKRFAEKREQRKQAEVAEKQRRKELLEAAANSK